MEATRLMEATFGHFSAFLQQYCSSDTDCSFGVSFFVSRVM